MDADLEPGVSQDTGPQSNELRQAASYFGRFRFRASALVRTLRRPRTASLNIRLALIQGAALQAAREGLKRYARVVLSGPRNRTGRTNELLSIVLAKKKRPTGSGSVQVASKTGHSRGEFQ